MRGVAAQVMMMYGTRVPTDSAAGFVAALITTARVGRATSH